MNNQSKTLLLLTVPPKHISALASVLLDLKKFSPNLVDKILVYHDGISLHDQKCINKIVPVEFAEYTFPQSDIVKRFNTTVSQYFSPLVFARFEAFQLIDDYSLVIYSDYDILIRQDISDLISPCSSGLRVIPSTTTLRDCLTQEIEGYKMTTKTFSGGLFTLHKNFPNPKLFYRICHSLINEYAELLYMPDIAVMVIAWIKCNFTPDFTLDHHTYCSHPQKDVLSEDVKILHCYGQPKFWNGLYCEQWEENYKTWINLGGTPYFERTYQYKLTEFSKKIYRRFKSFFLK